MIKIAITDDRKDIRDNLSMIFGLYDEVELVFVADDGEVAIREMRSSEVRPSVILMDIEMRKMGGVEATKIIKKEFPETKIIMLTIFEQDDKIFEAIKAGADGYLLKDEKPKKIIEAIQQATEGRMAMSPLIAMKTLELLRNVPEIQQKKKPEDYNLTKRETEILMLLSRSKTYQVIAEELFISPKTVRKHIENIYRKLDVHSNVAASNIVSKNNWENLLSLLF